MKIRKTAMAMIAFAMLGTLTSAQAGVYRWVDLDGKVHYSGSPPDLGAAKKESEINPERYVGPGAPAKTDEAKKSGASATPSPKKDDQAKAAADKKAEEMRAKSCASAQEALRQLNSGQRLAIVDENGERKYLDEAEIESRRKDAQAVVDDACSPPKK